MAPLSSLPAQSDGTLVDGMKGVNLVPFVCLLLAQSKPYRNFLGLIIFIPSCCLLLVLVS